MRTYCKLDDAGLNLVRAAMTQLQLPEGTRAFSQTPETQCRGHRTPILKLARTIADLSGCEAIQPTHVAEAIQYRPRRQN